MWWWTSLAAASAIVVALGLVTTQWRSPKERFALEDVNHDGKIDILDAFALARQVKQGSFSDKKLDLNGDRVIDEKDAATIAAHVVKLDRGGKS